MPSIRLSPATSFCSICGYQPASGEPVAAAVLTSTVSGDAATKIYFAGGSQALGSFPVFVSALAQINAASGLLNSGIAFKVFTTGTTFKVYAKGSADALTATGGVYISDADKAAGLTGYLLVEACYIVPDNAPDYNSIEQYLPNRTVST